ncbi:MAG: family 2 glycosyl transferase [Candidatus Gottesmanbacteria bacterium GW2011_GWA2_43_14]|uniref:Family 2 glycosyl transferase n=1 Tax=Candidatus Gottesmanbacteria bacterium GW2011_GWA2_43_14 TaxID=1618443 RepID=A0A0G1FT75_9BACT|nr:MAG: family 2 glycosyl transferase [Candidatus Gottesmanbacteria bacterium GW2011_GWA2_43_14]
MLSDKPATSFILCVYNGEKTLAATLSSLYGQKEIDLEIIAVNDGSEDKSGEILQKFKTKFGRMTIVNIGHSGLAVARNTGIGLARGDYLASAAQDDIYFPEKTIGQIKYLEKNKLDFCFSEVELIDSRGRKTQDKSLKIYNARLLPWPLVIPQVIWRFAVCSPTFLCRKNCYQKLKWNPGILLFNDKYLWIKMFMHFRGGKLPQVALKHRMANRQKQGLYKRNFPAGFLYLEHRAAVLSAVLPSFFPEKIFSGKENFFGLVSCILALQKNPGDKRSFMLLASIYQKYGFSFAAKHFTALAKI